MIRMACSSDAEAIAEIYRPYVLNTPVTFEYIPPSPQEMAGRMKNILSQFPYLVWEEDGTILGYAYAHPMHERAAYQWDAELSVYIRQDCRGRGIGSALYGCLMELLKRQGYYSLYACITIPNPASMAFHHRLGFEDAGTFEYAGYKQGKWYGVGWLIRYLRPFDGGEPVPPTPIHMIPELELQYVLASCNR